MKPDIDKIKKFEFEMVLEKKFSLRDIVRAIMSKSPSMVTTIYDNYSALILQQVVKYQQLGDERQRVLDEVSRMERQNKRRPDFERAQMDVAKVRATGDVNLILQAQMKLFEIIKTTMHPAQQAIVTRLESELLVFPEKSKEGQIALHCIMQFIQTLQQFEPSMLRYGDLITHIIQKPEYSGCYVIAKDFFTDFKNVSLKNALFSHLPQQCGVVKLPYPLASVEGDCYFDEFLFFSGVTDRLCNLPKEQSYESLKKIVESGLEVAKSRELVFAWRDRQPAKDGYSWVCLSERYEGQSLEESWIESCAADNNEGNSNFVAGRGETLKEIKSLLINLLVYIKSGRPDIRPFKNYIRYNSVTKLPHHQFSNLTVRDLNLVGYTWKKLPNYSAESWYSRPHFGWRRCGKERSDLVYTYIKGSQKSRKAGKDDDDIELPLEGMNVVEEGE